MNSLLIITVVFSFLLVHNHVTATCPEVCRCTIDSDFLGLLVDCSSQHLTEIPLHLPKATTTLLLKENSLTELNIFSFLGVSKTRFLDLSANKISLLHEDSFHGLTELRKLDMSNNCLSSKTDTYPEQVFALLQLLEVLYLNSNPNISKCKDEISSARYIVTNSSSFSKEDIQNQSIIKHDSGSKTASFHYTMNSRKAPGGMAFTENHGKRLKGAEKRHTMEPPDDYPDKALSKLVSLKELALTLVPDKVLGRGFQQLTKLISLTIDNDILRYIRLTNDTVSNVPHIEHLDLSACFIGSMEEDTFSTMENLTTLNLSMNEFGVDELGKAFYGLAMTKLQLLNISYMGKKGEKTIVTSEQLKYFRNLSRLNTIHAAGSKIQGFELGVLCNNFPLSLREVYLDDNSLLRSKYFMDLRCLENLEIISMEGVFVSGTILSPYNSENIQEENGKQAGIISKSIDISLGAQEKEFALPPKLKFVKARHMGLFYNLGLDSVNPNNSLQTFYGGENYFPRWYNTNGLNNITHLYLPDVSCDTIDSFFQSFPKLEVLDISGNPLKMLIEDGSKKIFAKLENLKFLILSRLSISVLPRDIFEDLVNLEHLDLSTNRISSFAPNISLMKSLEVLNLSVNQLNTLPREIRDHMDTVAETRNVTVDLTLNPIACVCENIDFLIWMADSKVNFGLGSNYICLQSEGWTKQMGNIFDTIAHLKKECGNFAGMFFGASASCLTITVILLVAIGYRFRWKLRYLYYATRLNFQRRRLEEEDNVFEFHAFVSYASDDVVFVMGDLKTQLEDNRGLRLCLHTRDFTPGQYIASNILDAIQHSRHTLMLVTPALLESDWCNYELQMALMEGAHTGRDVLLFLLYEEVPNLDIPRDILFNIQSHTYIEFPHTEVNREPFWERLAEALRK